MVGTGQSGLSLTYILVAFLREEELLSIHIISRRLPDWCPLTSLSQPGIHGQTV